MPPTNVAIRRLFVLVLDEFSGCPLVGTCGRRMPRLPRVVSWAEELRMPFRPLGSGKLERAVET